MDTRRSGLVKKLGMGAFAAAIMGAAVVSGTAEGVVRGPCVRGIFCLAIYAPVLCPNGRIYSNSCEAWRQDCQTNCVRADRF